MHIEFFQWKYIGGLYARVEENMKNEVLIIMDYHPEHKRLNCLKFYKEKGINSIDFPPNFPDLHPLENICGKIKKQIMKK